MFDPHKPQHLVSVLSSVLSSSSVSGLVVKSIVAIDGPRVRFAADAWVYLFAVAVVVLKVEGLVMFFFVMFL